MVNQVGTNLDKHSLISPMCTTH